MDQYFVPLAAIVVAAVAALGYWLNHRRHTGAGRAWCEDFGHPGEE